MTCTPTRLENGTFAIICTRGKARSRCGGCGQPADLLCDWKVKSRRSGTCDTPICAACTYRPADDKDLCPLHANEWRAREGLGG